ncbi:MAG: hypothetical protein V9F03_17255 [Microthrixaceae bacterium]
MAIRDNFDRPLVKPGFHSASSWRATGLFALFFLALTSATIYASLLFLYIVFSLATIAFAFISGYEYRANGMIHSSSRGKWWIILKEDLHQDGDDPEVDD